VTSLSTGITTSTLSVANTPDYNATGVYNFTISFTSSNTTELLTGTINVQSIPSSTSTFSLNVTALNNNDYTLNGSDRNGNVSGSDPDLIFNVGDIIDFNIDANNHPFYLKLIQTTGSTDQISGVINNGSTDKTISWTPTTAGTYYYQCSLHGGMVGTITIQ